MNKIFEKNKHLAGYYQTADGTAFYTENSAINHAKKLEDKTVSHIERDKAKEEKTEEKAPEYDMSMNRKQLGEVAEHYGADISEAKKKQDVIDAIDEKLGKTTPSEGSDDEGSDEGTETEGSGEGEDNEGSDEGADSEDIDESKA